MTQHDRDSKELRSLCAARDEARRERDTLRIQLAIMISRANTDAKAWTRDDAIRADFLATLKQIDEECRTVSPILFEACLGLIRLTVRAAILRAEDK